MDPVTQSTQSAQATTFNKKIDAQTTLIVGVTFTVAAVVFAAVGVYAAKSGLDSKSIVGILSGAAGGLGLAGVGLLGRGASNLRSLSEEERKDQSAVTPSEVSGAPKGGAPKGGGMKKAVEQALRR